MSIKDNLFAVMSASPGVIAIVGSGLNARIHAGVIPQGNPVPAYVYNVITGSPENIMDGAAAADHELVQLDAFALDYDTATTMRDAAKAAFEDLAALIARGIGAKCVAYYPDDYESDTKRHKRSIGLSFWTP